ncbi:20133_t:CDS:2, partial [Gigaspora margarita]
ENSDLNDQILPLDFVEKDRENLINEPKPYSKHHSKTNNTTTSRLTIAPPPLGLIIEILPNPSILLSQHHPTQDLDKEHLILIVNAEIEKTDM